MLHAVCHVTCCSK